MKALKNPCIHSHPNPSLDAENIISLWPKKKKKFVSTVTLNPPIGPVPVA